MTTNLYIGDHVFNLETLVFGYKIYDQAYYDLNLLITLIHLLPICFVIFTIKVKVVIIFVFFTHLTVTIIYYYLIQSFFHYKFN
jgi:hypothetical protein